MRSWLVSHFLGKHLGGSDEEPALSLLRRSVRGKPAIHDDGEQLVFNCHAVRVAGLAACHQSEDVAGLADDRDPPARVVDATQHA